MPGEFEECRRCCAGMDELTVCNERFGMNPFEETQNLDDYMAYSTYTGKNSMPRFYCNKILARSKLKICLVKLFVS